LPEGDVIALVALGRTQEESAAAAQARTGTFGFGGEASDLLIKRGSQQHRQRPPAKAFGAKPHQD